MQCPKCNHDVSEEAAFCPHCGAQLKEGVAPAPAPAAPAVPDSPLNDLMKPRDEAGPEEAIWEGGYSGRAMVGTWIGCLVVTVLLVAGGVAIAHPVVWMIAAGVIAVLWIGSLLHLAYKKISIKYELTNRKFVHKSGFLVRSIDRIELFEIKDVVMRQSLLERIVGTGTVTIISADQTHPELKMEGILDPQGAADTIDNTSRPVRERRTLITS